VHTRTVSPSVHPRPASGGATNFFLASALFHHSALRPTGREDTRCDRPMSATHTNYVHPHLARSQLALATFAAGTPHGVLGSVTWDWGTECFTTLETASADRHPVQLSVSTALRPSETSVGVFFPRYGCDRASDTPVATTALPPPHPPSGMLPLRRLARLLVSLYGSEDARAAKTTVDAFS
jgi:hypothetical protein